MLVILVFQGLKKKGRLRTTNFATLPRSKETKGRLGHALPRVETLHPMLPGSTVRGTRSDKAEGLVRDQTKNHPCSARQYGLPASAGAM